MLDTPVLLPGGFLVVSVHDTAQEACFQAAALVALGIEAVVFLIDPWIVAVPSFVDVVAVQCVLAALPLVA